MSESVTLNQNIQVACLPKQQSANYPVPFMDAFTAGWGDTDENGGSSTNILQNVKLKIYETNLCNNVLNEIPKDWTKQMCMNDFDGGNQHFYNIYFKNIN